MPKLRRSLVTGAISTLAAVMICSTPVTMPTASADPITDAKTELARLEGESSRIDSEYAAIQEKLTQSRSRLRTTTSDLAQQEKKVREMQDSATRVALAQFQTRGIDVSTQLFTSQDADSFLTQLSTTQQIESNMNSTLQKFQNEVGSLESLKKTAAAESDSVALDEKRLKDLKKKSEEKLAEAENLVNRLTAQQRAALQAAQQQANRAAANMAAAANRERPQTNANQTSRNRTTANEDQSVSGSGSGSSSASSSSASGRAKGALNFAIAQVGKSYRMGATGPGAYDCSGLTQAAYSSVGISLPRTSQSQYGVGRSISRSQLQPGDLVFFYSGISHVGIYLGNGVMVDARNSRVGVVYTNINEPWWPYAGARRIA